MSYPVSYSEFKYALSNSLFLSLSEDLSPRTMPQDYLA